MCRAEAGLPSGAFVFCCFAKHYKITEEIFGAWTTILRRAEGAILWLAKDNAYSEANLLEAARRDGIAGSRLIFSERVDTDPYLSRLGAADLFLDTFPYNAGTVASDAIRMRLPLITISGQAFAARMAGRLLHAIDAGDGICTTFDHYIDMAVQLATDQAAYERYKALFTDRAWDRTIGDIATFTKDYEETWLELIDRGTRYPRAGQSGADGSIFHRRCTPAAEYHGII
jgi:predicted O-linked N-acetylglucosamine transferase (SPINDLY family)